MSELLDYRELLLSRLERQPAELAAAIAAIPETEWRHKQKSDERTVHMTVSHVRDVEVKIFLPYLRRILTEDRPVLEPLDGPHFSLEHYSAVESVAAILSDLAQAREEALDLLRGLSPAGWSRTGVYPPSGTRTTQWWAERMHAHVQEHLEQIRRAAT